jgi:hypothetical protein
LLGRRVDARLRKDYAAADALLGDLRTRGVDVNDRAMEWRAGYSPSLRVYNASTQDDRDTNAPDLDLTGPPHLAAALGAALLTQWRGDGRRRGQTYTHGFHPYKALMEPLCVAQLLELLPGAGAIVDPFVGSGTTMVEVMLAGRAAIGSDLSELAVGIATYHCWQPSPAALAEFRSATAAVVTALQAADVELEAEGSEALRSPSAADFELARHAVAAQAASLSSEVAGALYFVLSFEEACVWPAWRAPRPLGWRLARTAQRYGRQVEELSAAVPAHTPAVFIEVADARVGPRVVSGVVVDGVCTSPPYPGVYTYMNIAPPDSCLVEYVATRQSRKRDDSSDIRAAEDHRLKPAVALEIGSRAKKAELSSDPSHGASGFAAHWQRDTEAWLEAAAKKLRPGGRIAMLIGDDSGVNCLASVAQAAAAVTQRMGQAPSAPSGCASEAFALRVLASASLSERATRPWAKHAGRGKGYRREHTILLEKFEL